MRKKPKLTLVDASTTATSAPPSSLGKTGRALWSKIMSEYEISDSGGLTMLEQIAAAADRLAEYAAIIEADGPVIKTRTAMREHPLLKAELATRSFIVRSLQRLGLDVEPLKTIGRPPRGVGWEGTE